MHNFIGIDNKMRSFRKGQYLDAFDEPTYLTFALDFKFDENTTFESESIVSENQLWQSPLFNTSDNDKSLLGAAPFLISRGYTAEADGIKTFKEILRYLTFQAPWYFQSISGLDKLHEYATDQSKAWKTKGVTLDIDTLEAVDLRMAEIAAIYRNSIFDNKYRRERVPDNLRWFSVDIYVAEFRNLRYRLPGASQQIAQTLGINTGSIGNIVGGGNMLTNVMDQYGYIKYSCRQCEFDFSKSTPYGYKISVGGDNRQQESNKFGIKVGWDEEEHKFGDGTRLYEDSSKTSIRNPWGARNIGSTAENIGSFLSGLPVIGDDLARAGQKAMDGIAKIGDGLGINKALEAAAEFINPPVESIGDVYDIGYSSNGDTVPERKDPPSGNVYQ